MKTRPITFNGPMVRAILEGKKTQTRRVIKPQPIPPFMPQISYGQSGTEWAMGPNNNNQNGSIRWWKCPYGNVGDRLWVQEAWAQNRAADDRIYNLEITAIRVERLQDITEQDAVAEGCGDLIDCPKHTVMEEGAICAFSRLWEEIYGNNPGHGWGANPFVWVIEFKNATV